MQKVIEEDLQVIKNGIKYFENRIAGKTFLITGGAGFLGSWMCDALSLFGAKIICVDNLSSGSAKNIEHLKGNKNFEFVKKDVSEFKTEKDIDYIIHMASIASPPLYQDHPISTLDANVFGIKNMLELAKEKRAKAFLFTSTSEVYGLVTDEMIPTTETTYGIVNSYGPRAMYDEGKRVAEAYCYSYFKQFNLPLRIARIFNTYGPRLDVKEPSLYGRALVKFVFQSIGNKDVTIFGDGSQTRSFCYVTDQIIGLIKLLLTPGIDGEIINIGNDEEITIIDLANKIIELVNSDSKLTFCPLPEDDPKRRQPDLTKAKKMLKYEPKVKLDDGLKKTIEWFKNN